MKVRLSLDNICVIRGIISGGWGITDYQRSESWIIMKYYRFLSVKYVPGWSALLACLHTILITRKNLRITLIFSSMIKSSECRVWAEIKLGVLSGTITRGSCLITGIDGCQSDVVTVSPALVKACLCQTLRPSLCHCWAQLPRMRLSKDSRLIPISTICLTHPASWIAWPSPMLIVLCPNHSG